MTTVTHFHRRLASCIHSIIYIKHRHTETHFRRRSASCIPSTIYLKHRHTETHFRRRLASCKHRPIVGCFDALWASVPKLFMIDCTTIPQWSHDFTGSLRVALPMEPRLEMSITRSSPSESNFQTSRESFNKLKK